MKAVVFFIVGGLEEGSREVWKCEVGSKEARKVESWMYDLRCTISEAYLLFPHLLLPFLAS